MSNAADTFRTRAKECRRLSALARDPGDRETLSQMAAELDAEADKIDAEESKPGEKSAGGLLR